MITETPAADIVWRIHTRINDAPIETEYMLDEAATEITHLRAENAELQRKLDDALNHLQGIDDRWINFKSDNTEYEEGCEDTLGIEAKLARAALTSIRGEA